MLWRGGDEKGAKGIVALDVSEPIAHAGSCRAAQISRHEPDRAEQSLLTDSLQGSLARWNPPLEQG